MCGSPSIDTSYQDFAKAEAERSRAEEVARQARIAEGMKQIGAVFEGGTYAPEGGVVQTYAGMQPVLDQRRAAMEGFYVPQLDKQFGNARDQLTYDLARAGQLTSSTAGIKQGDLAEAFALNRAKIDSDISSDIASTQTRINQQRQSLEAGLRASGDQTAAGNAALQSAVTFREDAPTLNPLGNIFYGLSQGIGAVNTGYETGRIKKLATPNPLNSGTGRVVRA